MRHAIFIAITLVGVVSSCAANAWSYIVIDGGGRESVLKAVPGNLMYPPHGVSAQVYRKSERAAEHGALLTPLEEQRRLNADMLIIVDVPGLRSSSDALPGTD